MHQTAIPEQNITLLGSELMHCMMFCLDLAEHGRINERFRNPPPTQLTGLPRDMAMGPLIIGLGARLDLFESFKFGNTLAIVISQDFKSDTT